MRDGASQYRLVSILKSIIYKANMQSHITKKSSNKKVGPIPVTTTSGKSCPDACPMKNNGCYASEGFHLDMHWKKVTNEERGTSYDQFIEQIEKLPDGPWRHNQAGDLSGINDEINTVHLEQLTKANGTRTGWTYTHKPIENSKFAEQNKRAIQKANESHFTINISANSVEEAERYFEQGFPSVVVVPEDHPEKTTTKTGKKLVVCPEQTGKADSCAKCLLCARKNRKVIIGFRVHGTGKNKISFN